MAVGADIFDVQLASIEFRNAIKSFVREFRQTCIQRIPVSENESNTICQTYPGRLIKVGNHFEFERWDINLPVYMVTTNEDDNCQEVIYNIDSLVRGYPNKEYAQSLCAEYPNFATEIALIHGLNPFRDNHLIAAHMIEQIQSPAWRTCVAELIARELENERLENIKNIEHYYEEHPSDSGFEFIHRSEYWPFKRFLEYSEEEFANDKDKMIQILNDWILVELSSSPFSPVELDKDIAPEAESLSP